MGYIIFLCNEKYEFSPIHWKSKLIDKVTQDAKSAETLSLETAIDEAIYISGILTEMYFGEKSKFKIPINLNIDSKSLLDSLFSTKKVKRKTMRVVISSIQQLLKNGDISSISHVSSKEQLADIFTKNRASAVPLLECLDSKVLLNKRRKQEEE